MAYHQSKKTRIHHFHLPAFAITLQETWACTPRLHPHDHTRPEPVLVILIYRRQTFQPSICPGFVVIQGSESWSCRFTGMYQYIISSQRLQCKLCRKYVGERDHNRHSHSGALAAASGEVPRRSRSIRRLPS